MEVPTDGMKAGMLPSRAPLGLQLPLQDDSRQHSWTAGKPAPKYRPATITRGPSKLHPLQRTSSGLQILKEEDRSQIQSPSVLSPRQIGLVHSAMQHQGGQHAIDAPSLWQSGSLSQNSVQSRQPVFTSYPPLGADATYAQTDAVQSPCASSSDSWRLHPDAATASTAGAGAPLLSMQPGLQCMQDSTFTGRLEAAQASSLTQDLLPPRAVSPFESVAEVPFRPHHIPQSIVTSTQSDRVHFADSPMFTPLDTPEGLAYRYRLTLLLLALHVHAVAAWLCFFGILLLAVPMAVLTIMHEVCSSLPCLQITASQTEQVPSSTQLCDVLIISTVSRQH